MKQELYKKLKNICIEKFQTSNNKTIFQKILNILSTENCFEKMPFEISYNILLDLGFSKKEALEIYSKLVE